VKGIVVRIVEVLRVDDRNNSSSSSSIAILVATKPKVSRIRFISGALEELVE